VNAQIDWTLLTALDLQPNCLAAWRNVAHDVQHEGGLWPDGSWCALKSGLLEPPCPTAIDPEY
jgi:hypothetical protein